MLAEKPEVRDAVDAVYALTVNLNRGDILTHGAIEGVLGLRPHEGSWDHVVNRARRRLERERGISTLPAITVGYELCTTARQLEIPAIRTRRGIRQLRRARNSVNALPEKGLTMNQRRSRIFMIERLKDTERTLRTELKGQQEQLRPTPTIPRRPAIA